MTTHLNPAQFQHFSEMMTPSYWVQRAIDRVFSTKPYPTLEERKRIFAEEKAKG